ncbi:MAG: hypothetical protein AAF763_16740 [Pseudomonadota bacterium]
MIAALEWLGVRARWVLALGFVAALAAPGLAERLRPALPFLVACVYALSMARLDGRALARDLGSPRRGLLTLALSAALLTVPTAGAWAAVRALGAGADWEAAAVWTFAAPPIASAAGLCFLMGWNAGRALQLTVAASLIMPALGPAIGAWLLGAAIPISPLDLGLRTAAMIAGGAVIASAVRAWAGPERIARNGRVFDGLVAATMVVFLFPLFDGVGASILARPGQAAAFLALACLFVFGPYVALAFAERGRAQAGALALVAGTRSTAIYLAALPPDPAFTLYVALYQLPMFATPLVLGAILRRRA